MLQASWLNQNATLHVPGNAYVRHLSHIHPHPKNAPTVWKSVKWNPLPHFVLTPTSGDAPPRAGIPGGDGVAPAACAMSADEVRMRCG